MRDFTHYVGIDWSGAKGNRLVGLAVAVCCDGEEAPKLVKPSKKHSNWSRQDIQDYLLKLNRPENKVLVGIDSCFALPFVDESAYFPSADAQPVDAKELWETVDIFCKDTPHLYAGPFVDQYPEYFLRIDNRGKHFKARHRVGEGRSASQGLGTCESPFHLIGPSQVGLSGFSTMRMLNALSSVEGVAIWPFDDIACANVIVCEIFATAFARMGGVTGKLRNKSALNNVLQSIRSKPYCGRATLSDHMCDAMVTAAGLRYIAEDSKYWNPPALSARVRETEGWVFGVM